MRMVEKTGVRSQPEASPTVDAGDGSGGDLSETKDDIELCRTQEISVLADSKCLI